MATQRISLKARLLAGCLAAWPVTGLAQAAPEALEAEAPGPMGHDDLEGDVSEVSEVVVTASRPVGSVVGDIQPEIVLSARDIRGYGVSSVSELVSALASMTASGQGRGGGQPVILVNGARVSSFAEIRDLPTEAILRVDILPEEVALKYGYPATAKVMNMVLRPRFRAITGEARAGQSTQGGRESVDLRAQGVRIRQNDRYQFTGKATSTASLMETDRDLDPGQGDGAFRSLLPQQEALSANGVVTRSLPGGVAATVNVTLDATRSQSQLGLDPLASRLSPLERTTEGLDAHAGLSLNGARAGWRWSATGNADRAESRTITDRALAGAAFRDKARSASTSADGNLVLNGTLFSVPAGSVSTSLQLGLETLAFDSRSTRAGVTRSAELSRDTGKMQASLDVPLARRGETLGALGNLSGNLNLAAENLSDFGTLSTVGAGINWSPVGALRLIASFTDEEGAPTVQQLGDPETATPGARVFDFRTGQSVEITRVTGGNRALSADSRQVIKLGANLKPLSKIDLTLQANYVRTQTDDLISSFPSATTQIEDAFPDRFLRDAQGRLVQIDTRPVNFDRRETEELRWGLTYRRPLASAPPPAGGQPPGAAAAASALAGQRPATDRPNAGQGGPGGPGGGGFRGMPGMGGPRGGNFQASLFHTVRFKDEILVRPGTPVLDLLDGAALGNAGGEPRHEVELEMNLFRNGLGARAEVNWQSGTKVRGGAGASAEDLTFSDLTTVDVRVFADLGLRPIARKYRWLRGARATLSIDNLFDSRQEVRSASGATPVSYEPDSLDPVGRTVQVRFRKLFF